ncbi:HlyD family secretion protein [Methylococcus sp. EFPC2]|uniref:HlyD family secretion protein n=1 Tax=Methylococcus sp. EFPC2 TaxID=2812648 RepID=UPI0019670F97|nr:efflux RND transporter periplasmic adaptor subunit [Methylococcus sp. EFPC2]QSA95789.1 efflux RND transporter periplasmic adaptor subunit [Methylococcus sp. EFPC2]
MRNATLVRLFAALAVILIVGAISWSLWNQHQQDAGLQGFAVGNGRLEARQVDVALKFAGKLMSVVPKEGDDVKAGDELARVESFELQAQLRAAEAAKDAATEAMHGAQEQVRLRQVEVGFAQRDMERVQELADKNLAPRQLLDQNRTAWQRAVQEQLEASEALQKSMAAIAEADARIAEVRSLLQDTQLTAPRDARVLYRLAEPGEVLKEGGKVFTLIDLADVYMIVYLPEKEAGRIAVGAEAQIRIDAWPDQPLRAHVSFVSPQAQFTPKQVETRAEREKLSFRVKVQLDTDPMNQLQAWIKPGLPGVALIRLDPERPWPKTP